MCHICDNLCFSESSKEQFASTNIAEELVRLFQKQTEHEKKEMIFEVLAPLAENGSVFFFFLLLSFTKGCMGCLLSDAEQQETAVFSHAFR